MPDAHSSVFSSIFISHASADDTLVKRLREALEALNIPVWADSSELAGGSLLEASIARAIDESAHFLVVIGPRTQNSRWVRRVQSEVRLAPVRGGGRWHSALDKWPEVR